MKRTINKLLAVAIGVTISVSTVLAQDYFQASGIPVQRSAISSAEFRTEFANIETNISDKLPPYTGNADNFVVVNSGGTALTSVTPAAAVTALGVPSVSAAATITGLWTFENQLDVDNGNSLRLYDSTDTDFGDFSHDGTDFISAFTTTTDWNITGITALAAGTVDADFDAITATSYGGITEANLLDKSATETISGAYTLTGGLTLTTNNIVAGTIDADFDAVTATSYGGIVEANLVDKSAIETISGAWTLPEASITAHEAAIDHDALTNFVANEHLDWTGDLGATNLHANNSANGALALAAGEVTQLANIDATTISAADWTAVAALAGTNTGDEVSASETVEGIVERATQAEVDAGTDTTRYVSPATLNAWPGAGDIKHKTADESVSSSATVQDDDHLVDYVLAAATYYRINGFLKATSTSSTPDLRLVFAVDNAFQEGFVTYHMRNASGTNVTEADNMTSEVTLAIVASVDGAVTIEGFILTHATLATNLDLQWAQSTSDATATTLQRGSWLVFTEMP